jgi:sulfur carrier protein ThiS
MNITLALFAYLSKYQPDGLAGRGARPMELAGTPTVGNLITQLGLPDEPRIVFVNGRHAEDGRALAHGDRVAIFPPIAGG